MDVNARIYIAGHRGLVGSALVRRLEKAGYTNLVLRTSSELDLTDQAATADFFAREKPEYVFLAAARVGGIVANSTWPADFIRINLEIQNHVIHQSFEKGVKRLLFLGSSCIYPKLAPQPMREEHLMTGPLEPTNEPYALAKIAGIKTCESYNRQYGTRFVSVMPTNLYGPGDNFDLTASHVLPAMIRKYRLAKLAAAGDIAAIERDIRRFGPIPHDILEVLGLQSSKFEVRSSKETPSPHPLIASSTPRVLLWGTGSARREFLHVDDMADACLHVMELPDRELDGVLCAYPEPNFVNVGTGEDLAIRDLAAQIRKVVGFKGETVWDDTKPDGTPRKLLDVTRLTNLGWTASIPLWDGIESTYRWYCKQTEG